MNSSRLLVLAMLFIVFIGIYSCKKSGGTTSPPPTPPILPVTISAAYINGISFTVTKYNITTTPSVTVQFSLPVDEASAANAVSLTNGTTTIPITTNFVHNDSAVVIQPAAALKYLSGYTVNVATSLKAKAGGALTAAFSRSFITQIDSTDKFPRISDSALLTLVQQQTFKYFWDFGHPTSGLARERTTSNDVVTMGGSGFGIMSIIVGISRNFISRTQGLDRISTIVNFLSTKASTYHGAFPHWMDGNSGATVPFSAQDDGADLVETAYLMQGLLCARQFFNGSAAEENTLRRSINNLWNAVQWSWFRQDQQNTLYWHWSPDFNWSSNQQISGWNEALITYVLAASANADSNAIPQSVYINGWAQDGAIINNNPYYGVTLPLGPAYGGPLFFAHYSFLGIDPHGLSDAYANYWTQDTAHSKINYMYCVNNPNNFNGYSASCWGLTASDEQNGYDAHAPDNDDGVITPSAAISSIPYTPAESMNALRFFYYQLGDKIWGNYGFADAFNLTNIWVDSDYLAIDQGPEIVMIENYRSGLMWNLFMSCPEVKKGLKKLGFQGPSL